MNNANAGSIPMATIAGSQFYGGDDGIVVSHTAVGTAYAGQLKITDSYFQQMNNGGITLSTGANAAMGADLVRSQVSSVGTTAISLTAGGTSGIGFHMRDSTLSNAASTLLRTAGTSSISVTLIRSHLHNSITAVDHGRGRIRMEQTNVSTNQKSLVNNGSGDIVGRHGTNWIVDNVDAPGGPVYITPTIISNEVAGVGERNAAHRNPSAFRSSGRQTEGSAAYVSTGSCTPNIASLIWKSLSRSSAARSNSRFFAASTISFSRRFSSFSMSFSPMDS